jgi:SnoaL-like domain
MAMTALDYEQIRQLLARYNFAIDLGDPDAWAACFSTDGAFECSGVPDGSPFGGRHEGTEKLQAYAAQHYSIAKGNARHWNWNLAIEGDGETATMTCYMMALSVGAAPAVQGSTGIYRDRLTKTDGEWRFVERHVTVDPARKPRDESR